ncbi:MAG: adenylosuccinate synthetase [Anaerolineae bacterium]|nr:adenylosuccinate synthetase [Anaerolineae bacterium]
MNWQTRLRPDVEAIYREVYEQGLHYQEITAPFADDPLLKPADGRRPLSIAVEGGAFGDEGKGRIVDELCTRLSLRHGKVLVYRWNGGANAGHTVIVDSIKIALHQLPSGVLTENATVILGKGMVLHPGDLLTEIDQVVRRLGKLYAKLHIDETAVLALDTHRAFEKALTAWESGGKGATGRGISPAYADVLLRHPVRMRDLTAEDWQDRLGKHYDLYESWLRGIGSPLAEVIVPTLEKSDTPLLVGSKRDFLDRLGEQRARLLPYVSDVHDLLVSAWSDVNVPVVFEGAQAVGLDPRFGMYPDVTASDPTFSGILHSTEGVVFPHEIAVRAGAIKATYSSSVGTRKPPTAMDAALAKRIRDDAHEYGATTGRPRDIVHIDIPCLRYYAHVSSMTHLILTHMDICYTDVPVQVCTHYTVDDQPADYRPDQPFLDRVTPRYLNLPSWNGKAVEDKCKISDLPAPALQYIGFLSRALDVQPIFATTGAARDALISWLPALWD